MKIASIFFILSLLGSVNASANSALLGWADDGDLILSEQETWEVTSSSFLFAKRLGRVSFSKEKVCINCGDFSDNNTWGRDHVVKRLDKDFLAFLKNQLFESKIFPDNVKARIPLRATLVTLKQESSVGAWAENQSKLTSGAVLTTRVSILYELIENDQVVGAWTITTSARSNSLAASARLAESIDGALKRNVRVLLLKIIEDYSPSDSARANQLIASLQGEADNTRSVMGYLVYGVTKTATTTAGVIGEGVKLAAQNSDIIADNINSTAELMSKTNRDYIAAVNESNRVLTVQAAERERARSEQAEREADRRSDAINERAARADAQLAADTYRVAETQRVADAQRATEERQQLSASSAPPITGKSTSQPAVSATSQTTTSSGPGFAYQEPDNTPQKHIYIKDDFIKGWSKVSAEEGCRRLNEKAAAAARNPFGIKGGVTEERFLSSGECSCTDLSESSNFTNFNCRIPTKIEVTSWVPLDPEAGKRPSSGMSK